MSNSSAPNTASQNAAPTTAHHQMHHHIHHHHQQTINSILNQVGYNSNSLSINTQAGSNYPPPASSGVLPSPAGQTASSSATPSNTTSGERYSSSETWTSVVHSLMCHLQSSDNEQFAKRAIESLAKKLKDKPDEMDALMNAVQKKGTVQTRCITIPRTLDGRLQVAGRKGFPHVIYARLWRWPDLHKNELKHLPICLYPFDLKLDNVCVNPYHYQRVISPGFDLAGLTLSNRSYNSSFMTHSANSSQISPQIDQSNELNTSIKMEPVSTSSTSHIQANSNQSIQNSSLMQAPASSSSSSNTCTPAPSGTGLVQQSVNPNPTNSQNYLSQMSFGNLFMSNSIPNQPTNSQYFANLNSTPSNQSLLSGNNQHNALLNASQLLYSSTSSDTNLNRNHNSNELQLNILNSGSNSSIPSLNQVQTPRRLTQDWQGSYPSPYSNATLINSQPVEVWLQEEFPEIDLNTPIPDYWCTINYYEGDLQIADIFKVRSVYQSVIIDGFFDSSREDRFCLGALTNVQRTNSSEKARLHIGKGVQLENLPDGSVYVRCLSEYSVFFESYYLDRESGREPFDAVHKIYPGSYVKVFNLKECLRCLKSAASVEQNNQQSPNSLMNNNNSAGINVDDLRRLCRLRFSFVKGWGPDYPRKKILETPCWCEVQLNRPLQFLDQLINSLSLNNPNSNAAIYPD